jgi:hypothetical protein
MGNVLLHNAMRRVSHLTLTSALVYFDPALTLQVLDHLMATKVVVDAINNVQETYGEDKDLLRFLELREGALFKSFAWTLFLLFVPAQGQTKERH